MTGMAKNKFHDIAASIMNAPQEETSIAQEASADVIDPETLFTLSGQELAEATGIPMSEEQMQQYDALSEEERLNFIEQILSDIEGQDQQDDLDDAEIGAN